MCEIALVVVDTVNSDFFLNCKCYKAGDIIDVLPDGWAWGIADQSNPNWRILKFPSIPISAFTQFLTSQIAADPNNPSPTLLRRAMSFNYASLAQAPSVAPNAITAGKINPYIADATRAVATLSVPLAAADIALLTVTKAAVANPTVIGNPAINVIG